MLQFLIAAETVAPTDGFDITSIASMLLMPLAIIAVFYFMIIRPEQKRKKSTQKMLSELGVGAEVVTRGGVVGKVSAIKDDKITIKSGADGTTFTVMRWAITSTGKDHTEPGR